MPRGTCQGGCCYFFVTHDRDLVAYLIIRGFEIKQVDARHLKGTAFFFSDSFCLAEEVDSFSRGRHTESHLRIRKLSTIIRTVFPESIYD